MSDFHKYILVPLDRYQRLQSHLEQQKSDSNDRAATNISAESPNTQVEDNLDNFQSTSKGALPEPPPPPGIPEKSDKEKSIPWYTLI